MSDREMGRGSMWTWIAVGCGGFVLLGIVGTCVGPGIFAMMMMDGLAGMGPHMGVPSPVIEPGIAGLELPVAEGPLTPALAPPEAATSGSWALVVTAVDEVSGVAIGDRCPFEVERPPRGNESHWCRTEIKCGRSLHYGGPGQGYFDCSFPETVHERLQAYDYSMQENDGDGSFVIDYDGNVTLRNHVGGTTTTVTGRLEQAAELVDIGPPTED